jgi:hypothetical protein
LALFSFAALCPAVVRLIFPAGATGEEPSKQDERGEEERR